MPRALPPLLALTLASCATVPIEPPPEHVVPFQFAPQRRGGARSRPARIETLGAMTPKVRLDGTLIRFASAQRTTRATTKQGAEMPEDARELWTDLIGHVDLFLRQRPQETVPLDLIRARVALEAELDMDGQRYAALPAGLATSVQARLLGLSQRLVEVRKVARPAKPLETPLGWPLEPAVVTSLFGPRIDPFTRAYRSHSGIDLQASAGQLIQSAGAGLVIRAEWAGGYGLHVEVEHDSGVVTTYSHLSKLLVVPGLKVPRGGPVGLAGTTGRSTGPHLHFEVWRDGHALDPLKELGDPDIEDVFPSGNIGDGE